MCCRTCSKYYQFNVDLPVAYIPDGVVNTPHYQYDPTRGTYKKKGACDLFILKCTSCDTTNYDIYGRQIVELPKIKEPPQTKN